MSENLATFGGGCFWCMEQPFDKVPGVRQTLPGYMGGEKKNPTYEEVCSGETGHVEVVQIEFEGDATYEDLLNIFWKNIDPTNPNGQFADQGSQYRPVIFYHDLEQKKLAMESKQQIEQSGKFPEPIAVSVEPAQEFYQAEQYHCRYFEKKPEEYSRYKKLSGREGFIKRHWT